MLLQLFLLGLIPAYASDFLTLVTNIGLIRKGAVITCRLRADSFDPMPLWVDGEVPGYRAARSCETVRFLVDGIAPRYKGGYPSFNGFVLYNCDNYYTALGGIRDEICDFHNKGTMKSIHAMYKGARMGDKVGFGKDYGLEFRFSDIYDGNTLSYGNFVGVFNPSSVYHNKWIFSVDDKKDFNTVTSVRNNPGTKQEVTVSNNLRSYVYPAIPDSSKTSTDSLVLSVGVFGTITSHHYVHSCMKGSPDGHCMHSSAKTFTKGGSDMLVMALPNYMETYYFEYSIFKFSATSRGGAYDRVIFKTSVVGLRMIDSFQKRVFLSFDEAGEILVAANLMRCLGTLETCMSGRKKSFKLTFYGYTKAVQVQKLIVHGGDIVVGVEDKDCQEQNSKCIVTAELFAYRNTQMWIEGFKDTHNGVINPDDDYQPMIFQDVTLVIEPAE